MKTAIVIYALLTVWTAALLTLIATRKDMPLAWGIAYAMVILAGYLAGCALIADRIAAKRDERARERDRVD